MALLYPMCQLDLLACQFRLAFFLQGLQKTQFSIEEFHFSRILHQTRFPSQKKLRALVRGLAACQEEVSAFKERIYTTFIKTARAIKQTTTNTLMRRSVMGSILFS